MWKIFLFCFVFLSFLLPWDRFSDPDIFYHAKISQIIWSEGALSTFSWLDLTSFHQTFADQHFLFHVIESPFVSFFGLYDGARLVTIVLASLFLCVLFASFRCIGIRRPLMWTGLVLATAPFLMRLTLGKATSLALIWFVLGLVCVWKRKPWFAMGVGILFALTHGGWVYLLGSVILLGIGDALYRVVVEERRFKDGLLLKEVLFSFFGVAIGLVIHPNFPHNIQFLWIQIVKIGLGTPFAHVMLGSEWRPATVSLVVSWLSLWIIIVLMSLWKFLQAEKIVPNKKAMHASIAFALPVAGLLALTFKSRRSLEYLVPALALWVPWLWMIIFEKGEAKKKEQKFALFSKRNILYATFLFLIIYNLGGIVTALRHGKYHDDLYRDVMAPVSERLSDGDRIFHSDWDEFPILWSLEPRARYVAGLDPTFLYTASSSLSDAYRDLTWLRTASSTTDEAWDLIHNRLGARFVFIDKDDHQSFFDLIASDPRYHILLETDEAVTFEIVE